jgi:hypothetical protein
MYSIEWNGGTWMMNWKLLEAWLNLRYYPGMSGGTEKNTENLSQDSRSPRRYLNPGPHEYEAVLLTTLPQRSVLHSSELIFKEVELGTRPEMWFCNGHCYAYTHLSTQGSTPLLCIIWWIRFLSDTLYKGECTENKSRKCVTNSWCAVKPILRRKLKNISTLSLWTLQRRNVILITVLCALFH